MYNENSLMDEVNQTHSCFVYKKYLAMEKLGFDDQHELYTTHYNLNLFPAPSTSMDLTDGDDKVTAAVSGIPNSNLLETAESEVVDNLDEESEAQCDASIDFSLPLHQILFDMNRVVCDRLEQVESRLDSLTGICDTLQSKVDILYEAASACKTNKMKKMVKNSMFVDITSPEKAEERNPVEEILCQRLCFGDDSNTRILTLNLEGDYPDGSWLGDEMNPEMRVRCRIPPKDLFLINSSNPTPEKLALALLDHLFDKNTLASSNISGTGKHKKRQLDPLMICGIWCHLKHRFAITDKHWFRIRQNLDSKCRSAFRSSLRTSIQSKANDISSLSEIDYDISSTVSTSSNTTNRIGDSDCDGPNDSSSGSSGESASRNLDCQLPLTVTGDVDFAPAETLEGSELVEVFEATPEQIAKIRESGFHILLDSSPIIASEDL